MRGHETRNGFRDHIMWSSTFSQLALAGVGGCWRALAGVGGWTTPVYP
ncbi:hypothetical protein QVH36_08015 [Corynebacterium rouxii]